MDSTETFTELADAVQGADTLIVAFSGGADSLLSLDLTVSAVKSGTQHVIAWYCHHYSTGITAERQAVFDACRQKYSDILGSRFHFVMHQADIDLIANRLGYSWEHTASLVRRKHVSRLAERHCTAGRRCLVITGHNYSDYVETLELRRARRVPEAAMPQLEFCDTTTGFLRPLYRLTHKQVRQIAADRKLVAYADPANADLQFARNRIRETALHANTNAIIPDAKVAPRVRESFHCIHRRELQLSLADWNAKQNTDRARAVYAAFRRLGIARKFTRNHFAIAHKLPFRLPPFFAHLEGDNVVFRRGLGAQVSLPQAEATPYLRGDKVTRSITVVQPFGHKAVSKIFSERKLSPRERRRTLVYLSAPDSIVATRISPPGKMTP